MGSTLSSLVFQPPQVTYALDHTFYTIPFKRNRCIPLFFINHQAEYTILFSHGNGEDIGMIYTWLYELSVLLHVNMVAYDYSGYGVSSGEACSEEACYENIDFVYSYLVAEKRMKADKIILYGRSLGSGPTCYLAHRLGRVNCPVAGIILQSPVASIYRVAFSFRYTMPGDIFRNIDVVRDIVSPITIIHGTEDEIVPFSNGEELFDACAKAWRSKPLWVHGASHNNIEEFLRNSGVLVDHLKHFIQICAEVDECRKH